jgi:glycosyltransferase involved in cell wall biosynthesis
MGSESLGALDVALYDPNGPASLDRLLAPRQVVVAPPLAPHLAAGLPRSGRRWIVDFYNPEPFEGLAFGIGRSRLERRVRDAVRVDRIGFAARLGAAFVCASERQRDMWLGYLAASRRLHSDQYGADPELRSLIDVVGYGLPDEPPKAVQERHLRGPIFDRDARIMVWNGGLWDWLDPLTVIRALGLLREHDPRWCLAFLGTARPSNRADMEMGKRAAALAKELGLADGAVHFREGWTRYDERGAVLLECDLGVSAHGRTLETRFAYRSRMLDFVWAGLPIVTVEGDEWARRVAADMLGEVVPPSDPYAFAAAARLVADRGLSAYAEALRVAATELTWRAVVGRLLRLVDHVDREPARRADLVARLQRRRHSVVAGAARVTRRLEPKGRPRGGAS